MYNEEVSMHVEQPINLSNNTVSVFFELNLFQLTFGITLKFVGHNYVYKYEMSVVLYHRKEN